MNEIAGERDIPGIFPPRDLAPAAAIGALTTLLHAATATRPTWGIFRDELYYVACSQNLSFGYVDHPPLVALVTRVMRIVLGDGIVALRLAPAIAAGLTVLLAGMIAREMGAGRSGTVLAAVCVALAPTYVALFGYLSMNALDVLFWAAGVWCLARLLGTGDLRLWIPFGAIAGLGLQNKISVLFLGAGVAAGLLLTFDRRHVRSRWFWLGGGFAGLLFLPHVVWQVLNDWPTLEFMRRATQTKNLPLEPLEFLSSQVMRMNPFAAPVAIAGLAWLLFARRGRPFRAIGAAFLAITLILITQRAKAYYLAPAYTMLFPAGAVVIDRLARTRGFAWVRAVVVVIVTGTGMALAPLAKPILPLEEHIRYAARLGQAPSTDERKEVGRLSQFFADRIGWRELAATVSRVYEALPPADRARACVYGNNYGQAGAIDYFRSEMPLPPAIAGHNSYWLWGTRGCTGEVMILLGGETEDHRRAFASVDQAALFTCGDCMPYENHKPIFVARGPRRPLAEIWPSVRHYD